VFGLVAAAHIVAYNRAAKTDSFGNGRRCASAIHQPAEATRFKR
jgi:hypothetical protein